VLPHREQQQWRQSSALSGLIKGSRAHHAESRSSMPIDLAVLEPGVVARARWLNLPTGFSADDLLGGDRAGTSSATA